MKSFLLTALSIFAISSLVVLSSCTEDKCKALVCAYGGTCNDGTCECITGYEGERCETVTRLKFKGVWNVMEDGTQSNPANYAVSIENGTNIDEVLIRNVNNKSSAEITAKVKGDTIFIDNQQFVAADGNYTIEGKGYSVSEAFYGDHGKLVISYKVTAPDGVVNLYGSDGSSNPSIWTK